MSTREGTQIDALTSYRGLAAGLVLVYHMQVFGIIPKDLWLIKYGFAGVGLFFALSGFLFTVLYWEKARLERGFLVQYFLKRVIRIYPLYFAVLLLGILSGNSQGFLDILSHATMTHGYFHDYRFSINTPMWTLSIEEAFYLSLPFLLVWLGALEGRSGLRDRPGPALLLGGGFLAFTVVALLALGKGLYPLVRPDAEWFRGTLFGRFFEFGVGIFCGLVALKFPRSRLLCDRRWSTLLGVAGLALFVGISYVIEQQAYDGVVPAWTKSFKILYAVSGGLLILGLLRRSYLNLVFDHPVAVYLGKISFALYLVQYLGVAKDRTLLEALAGGYQALGMPTWLAVVLTVVVFNVIAALFYHLVEHPSQKQLRAWLVRQRRVPEGALAPEAPGAARR